MSEKSSQSELSQNEVWPLLMKVRRKIKRIRKNSENSKKKEGQNSILKDKYGSKIGEEFEIKLKKENPENKINFSPKRNYKKQETGAQKFEMRSTTFKKVKCEFFKLGLCKNGDNCTFSHEITPDPYPVICKYYLVGGCTNKNCLYSHDTFTYPCKFLHVSGTCKEMSKCKFSHEQFKNEAHLQYFVQANYDAFLRHVKNNILTPASEYAMEKGFLDVNEDRGGEEGKKDFLKELGVLQIEDHKNQEKKPSHVKIEMEKSYFNPF